MRISGLDSLFHKIKMKKLQKMPRFKPGNIQLLEWNLDYLDGPSLWSCIDVLVHKAWNDFVPTDKHPVILDCGANIGISVLNYKRQFPSAKIIAFEADPFIAKTLKRNLNKNNSADVVVIEAAVWIKDGEIPFYCEGADGSRIIINNDSAKKTIVRSVDFSEYVSEPIDLIKMDIEGAEFEVVLHLGDKLKLVKSMVIECHIDNDQIDKFSKLLEVLAKAGFKVAINSYGAWRDLIRRPSKLPDEFDQYILIAAWR